MFWNISFGKSFKLWYFKFDYLNQKWFIFTNFNFYFAFGTFTTIFRDVTWWKVCSSIMVGVCPKVIFTCELTASTRKRREKYLFIYWIYPYAFELYVFFFVLWLFIRKSRRPVIRINKTNTRVSARARWFWRNSWGPSFIHTHIIEAIPPTHCAFFQPIFFSTYIYFDLRHTLTDIPILFF